MSDIIIRRPHALGRERALAVAHKMVHQLGESLDAEYRWEGEALYFTRTGASGRVEVHESEVVVEVRLGLLLKPLKGQLEQQIRRYLDQTLGSEPPRAV